MDKSDYFERQGLDNLIIKEDADVPTITIMMF